MEALCDNLLLTSLLLDPFVKKRLVRLPRFSMLELTTAQAPGSFASVDK